MPLTLSPNGRIACSAPSFETFTETYCDAPLVRTNAPPGHGTDDAMDRTEAVVVSRSLMFREVVTAKLRETFDTVVSGIDLDGMTLDRRCVGVCVVLEFERFDDEARTMVAAVHRLGERARIVVISRTGDARIDDFSAREGITALLPHETSSDRLGHVVGLAATGLASVPSELMRTEAAEASLRPRDEPKEDIPLSGRECEVLGRLTKGYSNKEIAREFDLAGPTVRAHVRSILLKLNVQNRTQAAVWALKHPSGLWS